MLKIPPGRLQLAAVQVGDEIGAGAHGVVFSGTLRLNGRDRDVAIKFMPGLIRDAARLAFQTEVENLARASAASPAGVTRFYGTSMLALVTCLATPNSSCAMLRFSLLHSDKPQPWLQIALNVGPRPGSGSCTSDPRARASVAGS